MYTYTHTRREKLWESLDANATYLSRSSGRNPSSKSPLEFAFLFLSFFLPSSSVYSLFSLSLSRIPSSQPCCYHGPLSLAQWPLLFSTLRGLERWTRKDRFGGEDEIESEILKRELSELRGERARNFDSRRSGEGVTRFDESSEARAWIWLSRNLYYCR